MRRVAILMPAFLAAWMGLAATAADSPADRAKAKKALQGVSEFIGQWNLDSQARIDGKQSSWKEVNSWGWKFQGDDAWLAVDIKDSKYFTKGALRYLPEKKQYQLTMTDTEGKEKVFVGDYKRQRLVVEHKDERTGDIHRLTMNTLSEGVRILVQYDVQAGGRGLFDNKFKAAGTKEGESFAGGKANKKPDCVVTGGAGTMPVSYMGKTYYVCCSGCREEFDANPKKYVDAYEKLKK